MSYNPSFWVNFPYANAAGNNDPDYFGDNDEFLRGWPLTSSEPVGTTSPWTGTALSSGTTAFTVGALGGVCVLSGAGTTDNSGSQIQQASFPHAVALGKQIDFKAKAKLSDATESELFVGLAISDTTLLDGTGTLAAGITTSDYIGFYKPDGATSVYFVAKSTDGLSIASGSVLTMADATNAIFEFSFICDSTTLGKGQINAYVNGAQVYSATVSGFTSSSAAASLGMSAALVSGNATGTKTATIDYIGARQSR